MDASRDSRIELGVTARQIASVGIDPRVTEQEPGPDARDATVPSGAAARPHGALTPLTVCLRFKNG